MPRKDVTKGLESLSDCVCSYSFWLEMETTSVKGGGAYGKGGASCLVAGNWGAGWR